MCFGIRYLRSVSGIMCILQIQTWTVTQIILSSSLLSLCSVLSTHRFQVRYHISTRTLVSIWTQPFNFTIGSCLRPSSAINVRYWKWNSCCISSKGISLILSLLLGRLLLLCSPFIKERGLIKRSWISWVGLVNDFIGVSIYPSYIWDWHDIHVHRGLFWCFHIANLTLGIIHLRHVETHVIQKVRFIHGIPIDPVFLRSSTTLLVSQFLKVSIWCVHVGLNNWHPFIVLSWPQYQACVRLACYRRTLFHDDLIRKGGLWAEYGWIRPSMLMIPDGWMTILIGIYP